MKIVARSLILLFVLLNFEGSAKTISFAEKRAQLITSWMEKKLELKPNQIPQIEALNLKCEKEIDRLSREKNGFSCMQAVRDSLLQKESEFRNILTSQQLESYLKCKCELKKELKRYYSQL
ncbi:hypothetical protein [Ancylomarina longa]|uniref:DUF4890 domain-containing protein n=1 Tax=Ancylomarina longa TaxID=2487017 RepID=A0A434AV44_9BACT|nr:hypothetical protein [Ancylomarina longa]RUT78229.1 hypothetical protein DLK05_09120 [Ancylomarina longa]